MNFCTNLSPLLFPKVQFDKSVYLKFGFQRTMELKWKLEDIICSFLVTDCEAYDLIEEMLDEVQKKKDF